MNRLYTSKSRLHAYLLLPSLAIMLGTACGAQPAVTGNSAAAPPAQEAKSPELDSADQRVENAKAKVDQARRQLSAAKALVKAADAELKASKADRDAIALRGTAQQLADASGFQSTTPPDNIRQIIMPPSGNRLTPVSVPVKPVPMQQTGAKAQAQSLGDFNSQQVPSISTNSDAQDLNANPKASSDSPNAGAPVPSPELKPQMAPEPNSVP